MILEVKSVFSIFHDCERIQELTWLGKKTLLLQHAIKYSKYYKDTTKNKKLNWEQKNGKDNLQLVLKRWTLPHSTGPCSELCNTSAGGSDSPSLPPMCAKQTQEVSSFLLAFYRPVTYCEVDISSFQLLDKKRST